MNKDKLKDIRELEETIKMLSENLDKMREEALNPVPRLIGLCFYLEGVAHLPTCWCKFLELIEDEYGYKCVKTLVVNREDELIRLSWFACEYVEEAYDAGVLQEIPSETFDTIFDNLAKDLKNQKVVVKQMVDII